MNFHVFVNFILNLFFVSVTVVESARRALQFLGLDGENSDVGFDVSKLCFWIINFVWMFVNLKFVDVYVVLLWWQAVKVNLIMTDYSMPGMTGYELLKKIKVINYWLLMNFLI